MVLIVLTIGPAWIVARMLAQRLPSGLAWSALACAIASVVAIASGMAAGILMATGGHGMIFDMIMRGLVHGLVFCAFLPLVVAWERRRHSAARGAKLS